MSTIILQEIGRISSKCGSREENVILKLRVALSTRKTQHKIAVSMLHQCNTVERAGNSFPIIIRVVVESPNYFKWYVIAL